MNIATLLGIIGAFSSLVIAIIFCGGAITLYLDLPSLVEVVVGSYFAMMVSTSFPNALGLFSLMGRAFGVPNFHEEKIITQLASFSNKARQEGLLALEEVIGDIDNPFMKKGLQLAVDGTDAAIIENMLSLEISKMQKRHRGRTQAILQWATVAPAVGMLGTVIGLVAMMKNLSDKDSVGPNMAMALITTLYGAIVAHFFCTPIAIKLKEYDAQEAETMEMILEGILAIQSGANPRTMILNLLAYLPPKKRASIEAELLKD
ncbi:MAG: motility protein A [Spirochaetaceae bacterium]|nr:motility protein A [Spirochaetaceae bacterium]